MLPKVTKRTYGKYEKSLSTLGKGITVFMKERSSVSVAGSRGSPWRGAKSNYRDGENVLSSWLTCIDYFRHTGNAIFVRYQKRIMSQ
jgi:hypothetical protein